MQITHKLSAFYLLYYCIVGTFMPFWSLYLEYQGFSYAEIGWLSSLAILTRFFAPLIWGWIADKTGKRMLLVRIATWVEACIWLTIFVIPNSFQSIALLMFIFSFFQNAILAQFEGVTLFWLGDKKQQLYGKVRKWGSVGFILGVFCVGAVFEIISLEFLPIILLFVSCLTFIWSLHIQEPTQAPKAQSHLESILPMIRQPAVWAFFLIELILLLSHAPFYSFYSNFLKQAGFTTSEIGLLWSTGVIAEIIMFAYANWFLQNFSIRFLVGMCLVLTALRWEIVGFFPNSYVLQFFAQIIHAFSFGLFHIIAMRIIFNYFTTAQQGRAQGLYSTMWGIGVALGSILAGHYWNILSGSYIFLIAGGCCLFGLAFIQLLPKKLPM